MSPGSVDQSRKHILAQKSSLCLNFCNRLILLDPLFSAKKCLTTRNDTRMMAAIEHVFIEETEMLASKYARQLPEVGGPITMQLDAIAEMVKARAELLEKAERIQGEIAAAEVNLALSIHKHWTQSEIAKAEQAAGEQR
jgi:hypothetical protein